MPITPEQVKKQIKKRYAPEIKPWMSLLDTLIVDHYNMATETAEFECRTMMPDPIKGLLAMEYLFLGWKAEFTDFSFGLGRSKTAVGVKCKFTEIPVFTAI